MAINGPVRMERLIWWTLCGTPPNEPKFLRSGDRNGISLFVLSEKYTDYMEQIKAHMESWRVRGWSNFHAIPSLHITHFDDKGAFMTAETEAYNRQEQNQFNKTREIIELE